MKTIKINGSDFTSFFTPVGARVTYPKKRGPNSGEMIDGSYTDDVITTKAEITVTCMPLNESQTNALLPLIARDYVNLYYYDPRENVYRSIEAMPSDPVFKYAGDGTDSESYWTGAQIVFKER